MNTKINTVIFDFDGTLADSMWAWAKGTVNFLKESRHYDDSKLLFRNGVNMEENAMYFIETFGVEGSIDEVKEKWLSHIKTVYMNEIFLKEGAKEFVDMCKSMNMNIAIVTGGLHSWVEGVIKRLELFDIIDYIVGSEDCDVGKSSPKPFLKVSDYFDVKPSECVVFEDGMSGLKGAKSAGMYTCGVKEDCNDVSQSVIIEMSDNYICSFNELIQKGSKWYDIYINDESVGRF